MISKVMPHILLYGKGGSGKTTLARIVVNELRTIYATSGVDITYISKIAASVRTSWDVINLYYNDESGHGIATNDYTVMFLDEIHELKEKPANMLYDMMEDNIIPHPVYGELRVPPLTIIGATTKPGELSYPTRRRFPLTFELKPLDNDMIIDMLNCNVDNIPTTISDYKGQDDIKTVLSYWLNYIAGLYGDKIVTKLTHDASRKIASVSGGCPSTAKSIAKLSYIVGYNNMKGEKRNVDINDVLEAIYLLGMTDDGLTRKQIQLMKLLLRDGKRGMRPLRDMLELDEETYRNIVESPLLNRFGYISISGRGRQLTDKGIKRIEKFIKEGK